MKNYTHLLLFIICFSSCVNAVDKEKIVKNKDIVDPTVKKVKNKEELTEKKYNELAQFLGGYNCKKDSSLKSLESSQVFKDYQSKIDMLWRRTEDKIPIMKDWSSKELSDLNKDGGTLFYPFSGADFLHADLFFPNHDHFVMIGLEPIGTFPNLRLKTKDSTFSIYMSQLKKSMNAILGMSFFRTIAMAKDFKSDLDGTLHVLMHFFARTNHEVLLQEKVAIMPNGSLSNDLSELSDSTYIGNRYYFKRNGEEKIKSLVYFAVNIQNDPYLSRGGLFAKGLKTRTDLVAYLNGIDIKSTYLKSASYLMHRPTFSIIRNLILNKSQHLLQDDSGIPIKYFDSNIWDLTYYGNYSYPIPLFKERHQEDLKEVYLNKDKTKPLPFGIGYQFRRGTSNLMRASKK